MRQMNVALDLYGGLVSLVLFTGLCLGTQKKDTLTKCFLWMCFCNVLMSAGDISNWCFEGYGKPWYPLALRAGTILYWFSSAPLLLAFTAYLIEYLSPKARISKKLWFGAAGLCLLHLLGSICSLWDGIFFYISEENLYQRGRWFFISQLIPALIYGLDVIVFIAHRKKLEKRDFYLLSSCIVFPLIAEIIQMTHYGTALLNPAVSITLLLIFIRIHQDRELQLERKETELAQWRIDSMLSQIQPHFLYNTLTVIRRLCDMNPQEAKEAIQDFALFLRGNMDSLISKIPIPFEKELAHTQNYLNLEKRRFGDRLSIVYEIEAQDFAIPPLTLQPMVENAVRHGVLKKPEGGTVTIQSKETRDAWVVIVADNGVGFSCQPASEGGQYHIGIENVKSRLEALCSGSVEIASKTGYGTVVTITIPKNEDRE